VCIVPSGAGVTVRIVFAGPLTTAELNQKGNAICALLREEPSDYTNCAFVATGASDARRKLQV
jgi:hypothetical protein